MAERSPNFPSMSLAEAIDAIRLIYQREGRSKMPRLSAVRPLGYTSMNGRSLSVLGALRAYNLLDGRGDDVRVSENALTILNAPLESEERAQAIIDAYEAPAAFALLRAKEDASAETLRWHLIKANFRDDAADRLLNIFLESRNFVSAYQRDASRDQAVNEKADESNDYRTERDAADNFSVAQVDMRREASHILTEMNYPDFIVKLGDGITAIIEIKGGDLQSRHLSKLERFIGLQKQLIEDDD